MNQITKTFNGVSLALLESADGTCLSDEQLGRALGYADPAKAIQNLVARDKASHNELAGLSTTLKLRAVDQKMRQTRVWGRDGVIALSFLADTPIAAKLRAWARVELTTRANAPAPVSETDRLAATTNKLAELLGAGVIEAKQLAAGADAKADEAKISADEAKRAAAELADRVSEFDPITLRRLFDEIRRIEGEAKDLVEARGDRFNFATWRSPLKKANDGNPVSQLSNSQTVSALRVVLAKAKSQLADERRKDFRLFHGDDGQAV
jgi:prophage antirepressor-like protein